MAEYLPPRELWPKRLYTLPEFATYAERFNPTEELLGKAVAAGRGERTAVLFEDQRFSYNQLLTQANKFANALRDLGVEEGDRVILRTPNIPPALVANFAILKLGAVCTPTSPLFSRTEIAHVANDAEAVAIIVSSALLGEVEAARENLQTVKHIIVVGGDAAEVKAKGFLPYGELLQSGEPTIDPVLRKREDVGLLLYTSGTTGRPKGTVHFVEELLVVPDSFGKYGWKVAENDVIGGSAPLAFGAGYSSYATIPFRFGAAASLIAKFEPEKMFDTIQKHHISILTLAPTAYRKMLQVPEAEKKFNLSSLRVCTGGGESLTAPTYHAWKEKFGLEIFEGLGTTEMMYVFASNVVSRKAKAGSFGQAVPGYELKVIDEEGKEAKPGNIGHFVACGPTGTIYWRDPDKQRHAITPDGWNRAGDYVSVDSDGYFWFVSREDDIIKSSGYRIGPEEIEVTLATHPAVAEVGVIGVHDDVRGQIAKAFVVLKAGQTATGDELIAFCKGKIATYKLPREVVIVSELPRTPTGKLLRRVLKQREPAAQPAAAMRT
ncbi:MAG TPA: acyl-CoA synthetase [Terriglobales bacterium]|jgi:2-aminobenzoate-CoA ligase|nr:acyl-CoA synthetase [Terriglobales bacterium]